LFEEAEVIELPSGVAFGGITLGTSLVFRVCSPGSEFAELGNSTMNLNIH